MRPRFTLGLAAALPALLAPGAAAQADGWHQYNGPDSTRTTGAEPGLVEWPDSGPPVVWKTPTELGFSSFVIAEGRAFTLVLRDSREVCVALDVEDGAELWATPLAKPDYDRGGGAGAPDNSGGDGPRSTPSHDTDHVYVLGAGLDLVCLKEATGEKVWSRDIVADHGGRSIRWQNAASPLVEGDLVLVAGGGEGRSLLAFHKLTGELAWSRGDELMTHRDADRGHAARRATGDLLRAVGAGRGRSEERRGAVARRVPVPHLLGGPRRSCTATWSIARPATGSAPAPSRSPGTATDSARSSCGASATT